MLLGVDVGGTFTDAVLIDGERIFSAKAPSTPGAQADGVLRAIRAVLARARREPAEVERFAHGMTVATNALLEGRTARTALIATEGFTDLVELGRQARPELYRLCAAGPAPLVPPELRFGAPERATPQGILRALDGEDADALVQRVLAAGVEAVAVVLLHSYAQPAHERMLGERLAGKVHCSLSHDTVGTIREFERAATTELDAALSPLLARYLGELGAAAVQTGLPEPAVMQSSGGLSTLARAREHAAVTVLSGPAGGAGAAALLARLSAEPNLVSFDMGGTSCDVCVVRDGEVGESAGRTVAGRPLALPMLDIHTVGAGGGSVAWADGGGALRVGPRSAGAQPGPACYGRGGSEPTVTDADVLLGRLPLDGELDLDRAAAERAVGALAGQLGLSPRACAEGIVRVADAAMAGAVRVMTVARGLDPRGWALLAFGGAGGAHACALAEELGMGRVLVPRAGGVLSALGLAAAAPRRDVARSVVRAIGEHAPHAELADLVAEAEQALGAPPARRRARLELRYVGQSFELAVDCDPADPPSADWLRERFEARHEERYGYRDPGGEVELVTIRASVWGEAPRATLAPPPGAAPRQRTAGVIFDGREVEAEIRHGDGAPGLPVRGPLVWAMPGSTLVVPPGWEGGVDAHGTVVLVS